MKLTEENDSSVKQDSMGNFSSVFRQLDNIFMLGYTIVQYYEVLNELFYGLTYLICVVCIYVLESDREREGWDITSEEGPSYVSRTFIYVFSPLKESGHMRQVTSKYGFSWSYLSVSSKHYKFFLVLATCNQITQGERC